MIPEPIWYKPWTWHLYVLPWYDRMPATSNDGTHELSTHIAIRNLRGLDSIGRVRKAIAQGRVIFNGTLMSDPYYRVSEEDESRIDVWIDRQIHLVDRYLPDGLMVHTRIVQHEPPIPDDVDISQIKDDSIT